MQLCAAVSERDKGFPGRDDMGIGLGVRQIVEMFCGVRVKEEERRRQKESKRVFRRKEEKTCVVCE